MNVLNGKGIWWELKPLEAVATKKNPNLRVGI